jgi:cytochrome b6-f complex iron-sulfur subunit
MMEEHPQSNSEVHAPPPELSRRRFLYYLLGFSAVATAVGVLTPVVSYIWPPSKAADGEGGQVEVGKTTDFPAGTGKVVPVNDKPVIVVNTTQGGLKAYSAICTHFGCIVAWDQPRQFILCPCHDGRFNPVNGAVISGPPPAPLPEVPVTVVDDTVYVSSAPA